MGGAGGQNEIGLRFPKPMFHWQYLFCHLFPLGGISVLERHDVTIIFSKPMLSLQIPYDHNLQG